MATFCCENQVYSGQKNGCWIVKGRFIVHCAIRLSSTPSSLTVAFRTNGGMGEWLRSLGECFLSVALKLREESYKERLCFSGHFMSHYRKKNYGYQMATLPLCSFQDLTDICLWKISKFIRELPSIARYYWRMIAVVNTNLYGETEKIEPCWRMDLKWKIMMRHQTSYFSHETLIRFKCDYIHECMNPPLMAGGRDSVAGVILLSFPQTGAGCWFKALVSMFQQTGSKREDKSAFTNTENEALETDQPILISFKNVCIVNFLQLWLLRMDSSMFPEHNQACFVQWEWRCSAQLVWYLPFTLKLNEIEIVSVRAVVLKFIHSSSVNCCLFLFRGAGMGKWNQHPERVTRANTPPHS